MNTISIETGGDKQNNHNERKAISALFSSLSNLLTGDNKAPVQGLTHEQAAEQASKFYQNRFLQNRIEQG
jgi:hypothetical protein